MRTLVAVPIFNEAKTVEGVVREILKYADDVLVIDDGSTDATGQIVSSLPVHVLRHHNNQGYGSSLIDAFAYARCHRYDWVITIDCDEQHEPARIPMFLREQQLADSQARKGPTHIDIISGSRYIATMDESTTPPADRRAINVQMTHEINELCDFGAQLTDTFCGFKSHRVSAMNRLRLSERGYAFPMQLWVQAAFMGLGVKEVPVKLIYKDLNRTFGAALNDPAVRLAHYRQVLHQEIARLGAKLGTNGKLLPTGAMA
jgi:glycosyltransferase involved in cell wall biosynthesis